MNEAPMNRPAAGGAIPVTIVTGFLGSGKTTLLRGLVERRQTRRLALLINEFGEVSIDGLLMAEGAGSDQVRIHDFPHGLIAYGDDALFIPTMRAIAARRAQVDHVLIETSGLALPTAVMELLQGPALAADFVLDATLVVVDAPLLLSDQFEHGAATDGAATDGAAADGAMPARQRMAADSVASLFERQLEYADVVVLNKIDELDEDALLLAESRVRSRAPNVRFLELAYKARLDIRLALGLRLHQPAPGAGDHGASHTYTPLATMPGADMPVLARQNLLNGHAHSGLSAHSHGLATHRHFHEQDPGWLSFVLRCPSPQDPGRVKKAVLEAARLEPILRSKGFIRIDDSGTAMLVQGVRARVTLGADAARPAAAMSELVFIGYHPNRGRVAALLSAMTGTAWR
jgi:cobalamin biosynthesis protein CobW